MSTSTASALWSGTIKEGKGEFNVGSNAISSQYTFASRFENQQNAKETNPEELIGAAQAACFSMALAGNLGRAGAPPETIETNAVVNVENTGDGFKISLIELTTQVKADGIDAESFEKIAQDTKATCPVSVALTGTTIDLVARLVV